MRAPDLATSLRRLEPSGWVSAARQFAASLRTAGHEPGQLLVVGTPDDEPWHLAAHLDDTARWGGAEALRPVLVRRQVPAGAPAHLSVGLDAVAGSGRGQTVLVSAPTDDADAALLERLDDARRRGATLFALHDGAAQLDDLAHASLHLPPAAALAAPQRLPLAEHVLSAPRLPAARRPLRLLPGVRRQRESPNG